MASLNPDELIITSFITGESAGTGTVITAKETDNCVSPLCMTEDRACTTPWCPKETVDTVGTIETAAG